MREILNKASEEIDTALAKDAELPTRMMNGQPYFVMEYVSGVLIEAWMAHPPA